jgi:RND family efflux transporter MFP subunit
MDRPPPLTMLKYILIAAILGASTYAGMWYLKTTDLPNVHVTRPQPGDIQNVIDLTGKVINDRTVTLSALVNGQITEMKIIKGQIVEAGQVLARFDSREADAELQRLQAESELAEEKLRLARNSLERLVNMGSHSSVSQQQLDDARTEWRITEAQLKVSRAAYRIAAIKREKFDVTAPFDGVITEKTTEVGQWLEAGTPLFTLVAQQGREIEVNIDSSDRGQVKLEQKANLSAEAWPDQKWVEHIHWLAPAVNEKNNEAQNNFNARLTLGLDAPPLILGQQVDVELILEQKPDVLKLPYSVLIEKDGNKQLAVVDDSSHIRLVDIRTGIEDVRFFEVISPHINRETRIAEPLDTAFTEGQLVTIESAADK